MMKQPSITRWFTGNIFNVLACVCVVTLVAWNGYNTRQIDQIKKKVDAEHGVHHQFNKRSIPRQPPNSSIRGGAIYIRWGRSSCGSDSELVYEGHAGGSWYNHEGGASNYVCLPKLPIWGWSGACYAFMYGAEYQSVGPFLSTNHNGGLGDQNVRCAVCRNRNRASQVMIPARNVCYEGWTLEYHGYLMTNHHNHKTNCEYVCVDEAPEGNTAGYTNEDGALFYTVCAKCGSLPCPDYIDGKTLTCAVCTK